MNSMNFFSELIVGTFLFFLCACSLEQTRLPESDLSCGPRSTMLPKLIIDDVQESSAASASDFSSQE
jgi:hypothetical protein